MPNIRTLVKDIYGLFDPKVHIEPKEEHLELFATNLKNKLREKLAEVSRPPTLRMSNLGTPCSRQLWYTVNQPQSGEGLRPNVYLKFLFGDIIEELVLLLARVAGHEVVSEQKQLSINGINGRCDAVIDEILVDVKSASSRSFDKFEKGLKKEDDGFGYLTQLGLYNHADGRQGSPAAFLVLDKQNGTLALDVHKDLDKASVLVSLEEKYSDGMTATPAVYRDIEYETLVEERKAIVAQPEPPPRGFSDVPEGASGNRKLNVNCSYCPFKHPCWPGVKTYLYARGPVFLTKVVREPNVPQG